MIGNHQEATKEKIGTSVQSSGWRRRTKDSSGADMQSAVGQWDEDYFTPAMSHLRARGLWEEVHNAFRSDR